MQSEFINVDLDQVRYSLVWEDAETLYNALEIDENDRLLIITSAGCNVLNSLLRSPATVIAIDLNPVQNHLLRLKKHIILNHSYTCFRDFLGLGDQGSLTKAWKEISETLPGKEKADWQSFISNSPDGILTAGKLEKYILKFRDICDKETRNHLKTLSLFDTVEEQKNYFIKHLHNSSFREKFINYFDEANLSKGRDPKLFKYAKESGGTTFYNRLLLQLSSITVKHNFFFNFFFFGSNGLDEAILPPCYQEKNYGSLRQNLKKLSILDGEAVDYLLSEEGKSITKASLSNIFEYTSEREFDHAYQRLFKEQSSLQKILFWNLLNQQGNPKKQHLINSNLAKLSMSRQTSCFYFSDIKIIENQKINEHLLISSNHASC